MKASTISIEQLTVVVGAAGTVGREITKALSSLGAVRGIVRRPTVGITDPNVRYAMADHGNIADMARVMQGAKSLVISIGTSPQLVEVEKVAIDAAAQAGVSKIVKISAPAVENVEVSRWHQHSEENLGHCGIDHTIIRPTAFMQNWLRSAKPIKYTKRITGSAGDGARNYVDVRDVAVVAAFAAQNKLCNDQSARIIDVGGPEALSNQDVAARLSVALGRSINYKNLSRDDYRAVLSKRSGLPSWLIEHLLELEELASAHPETGSESITRLTAKRPRTFDEFAYENRQVFQSPRFWPFQRPE